MDYVTFFKCKDHSSALTSNIGSSTDAKTKNKAYTVFSTSVKNTYNEVSVQIELVN